MRLWTLKPSFIDGKGLLALWREGLLAKAVLEGKTKGYKEHPQLDRFKASPNPIKYINAFLFQVMEAGHQRGYHFNARKIQHIDQCFPPVVVTDEQVKYEFMWLSYKLSVRGAKSIDSATRYNVLQDVGINNLQTLVNPLFRVVPGDIEHWEVVKEFEQEQHETRISM